MRYAPAAALALFALLVAAGCDGVDQVPEDAGRMAQGADTEVYSGLDADASPSGDGTADSCPDEVMERDGVCREGCGDVDPDCGGCPDPEAPDINYIEGSDDDPTMCQGIDFRCVTGWAKFDSQFCGCGCRKKPVSNGDICEAMDARSEGVCDTSVGAMYDGGSCIGLRGCYCEGEDCDRLYGSRDECERATGDCDERCGDPEAMTCDGQPVIDPRECPPGTVYTVKNCKPQCVDYRTCRPSPLRGESCERTQGKCDAATFCDYPNDTCGDAEEAGTCRPLPRGCPLYNDPVCGCDQTTYDNRCRAHRSGVDIASKGACPG